MTEQAEKSLAVYLFVIVVLAAFVPVAGEAAAVGTGNTGGTLSGGNAAVPSSPPAANMPTAILDDGTDAHVTVGYEYSGFGLSPGNTQVVLYADGINGGNQIASATTSSTSGTETVTIPGSYDLSAQQAVTLQVVNPNVQGPLAYDRATLEVREVGSAPAIDMRNFTTRGQGTTQIRVGYNMAGHLAPGDTLTIRATWPDSSTTPTADLSATPKGVAPITVPANIGAGQVTFELLKNGSPVASTTARHSLEAYISAQHLEYVNGTKPTLSNIGIQSRTIYFGGQGGMFMFTLVDQTKTGYGNRDLSGANVGADESTLLWANFTVQNYAPDILQGPGDVEMWQSSTSGSAADVNVLVHPTSVYRYSSASGFDPTTWKSAWDLADYGLDASVSLAAVDIPGGFGSALQGARLTTDAQFYNPPRFQSGRLAINVAAPHCKDNATSISCSGGKLNDDGFYKALIPKSFYTNKWGAGLEPDDLAGTYDTGGTSENLNMSVTKHTNGDLEVTVTNIHYSDGTIKLEPDSTAPTAKAGSDISTSPGTAVTFDGSGSSDNRKIATYEWDVDGDGTYEKSGSGPSYTYSSSGDRTVTLKVTDGNGNTDTDTLTVSVASTASTSGGGGSSMGSLSGYDVDFGSQDQPTPPETQTSGTDSATSQIQVTHTVDLKGTQTAATVLVPKSTTDQPTSVDVSVESSDHAVGLDTLEPTVTTDESYSLETSVSTDPPGDSPGLDTAETGSSPSIGYISVEHSVPDDDISDVGFQFQVTEHRLTERETTPDEVVLYRYHDDSWNDLSTTLLGQTDDGYRFEATSPGLSTFAIGTAPTADVQVTAASLSTEQVSAGDTASVTAQVRNDGTANGSTNLQLLVDGSVVGNQSVSVAAGATTTATFDYTFETAGEYSVAVNDTAAGSVTVAASEQTTHTNTTTPTETTTTPQNSGPEAGGTTAGTATSSSSGPGFTLGLTVVALLAAGLVCRRRS